MNNRMLKRLERFQAVANVLAEAPANARAIPAFNEKVALLREKIAAIHAAAMKQTKPTAPVTIASRERFEELIDAALHLAGVVGIVARERHMPVPAASVKFTRNDFIRLRSPNRTIPAERIIDAAEGFAADLVPYGITAATLAEFREKITAAKHGAVAPRVAIGARRAAAALLAELYRETNDLLTHTFDVLMLPLRRTDRSFYTKYQLARTVNQRRNGSRRKSPAGDAAAPRESIPA